VISCVDSPVGRLWVTLGDDLAVRDAGFEPRGAVDGDTPAGVSAAMAAYFTGDLTAIDEVAVAPSGTAFDLLVWSALREIPGGATASYTELAARIGRPSAVRAVAAACGRNPIAVFIPCHRVIRSDGALGGYAYGLERKRLLLEHERRSVSSNDSAMATPPSLG
jgi:methylated-DNA-[protein]-cysteine S-methyltransferase